MIQSNTLPVIYKKPLKRVYTCYETRMPINNNQTQTAMEPIRITYKIGLNDKVTEVFDFDLDAKTFELISTPVAEPPKWTELAFKQCSHCPLKAEEHPHCPMALQLHKVVERFHETRSIDEVNLEVITEERTVVQTTALQRVLSSMLGLIFPTCGCPKTAYMRPMARFHLPLASEEETVFRVAGMYLVAQYFLTHNGKKGQFAFDGLISIYEDFHILNKAIASRLQYATDSDSSKNAITLLDMYSSLVPMLLEDQLAEIRGFFTAYLPEDEVAAEVVTNNYLEKAKAFALELETDLSIVPVDTGDSGVPAWLRGSFDDDEAKPAGSLGKPDTSAIDAILSASSLSLSLEPTGDVKPPPPTGKAVFVLPDDEPPPKKP
jgi:hypothetical protein